MLMKKQWVIFVRYLHLIERGVNFDE